MAEELIALLEKAAANPKPAAPASTAAGSGDASPARTGAAAGTGGCKTAAGGKPAVAAAGGMPGMVGGGLMGMPDPYMMVRSALLLPMFLLLHIIQCVWGWCGQSRLAQTSLAGPDFRAGHCTLHPKPLHGWSIAAAGHGRREPHASNESHAGCEFSCLNHALPSPSAGHGRREPHACGCHEPHAGNESHAGHEPNGGRNDAGHARCAQMGPQRAQSGQ